MSNVSATIKNSLRDPAEPVVSTIREGIHSVGRSVSDVACQAMDQVKETSSQVYEQVKQQSAQGAEQLEKQVKADPMKALLLSAGVGVLLGLFLKR